MIKIDFCYQPQEWCIWLLSEYIYKRTVLSWKQVKASAFLKVTVILEPFDTCLTEV